MALNDEDSSSPIGVSKNLTLVSFVGFQEHLVMNFLRTFIGKGVTEILLFSSRPHNTIRDEQTKLNIELRNKAVQFSKDSLGTEASIVVIQLENIWDFQEYYVRLSQRPIEKAIVNISAGPAVFAAAGMIWAMEKDHYVSYSVEYHSSGKLVSSVFNLLDLRPHINSIFLTDNVDKMIIDTLRNGSVDTLQIHRQINDVMKYRISLRSVEIHLGKLNKLGIVEITRGKVNKINLSQSGTKIGF